MFEAFLRGINDGCLPLAFLRLMAFYIILSWYADTKRKVLGYGLVFLPVVIVTELLISAGVFDVVFIWGGFPIFVKILAGVCCAVLLVFGALQALDWWRLKGEPGLLFIRPPAFWGGELPDGWRFYFAPPVPKAGVGSVFCVALTGFGASLIAGFWQGDFVFQTFSFLLSGQDHARAFALYSAYLFGQIAPLFMVWIFTAAACRRWSPALVRLSFHKVIVAAFCLAAGGGLLLGIIVNMNYIIID